MRAKLKLLGLCRDCRRPSNNTYCDVCIKKGTERNRKLRNIRLKNQQCTECGKVAADDYENNICRQCLDKEIARCLVAKKEVFDHYSKGSCVCCGVENLIFLSLDHVNNNGAEHRREINNSTGYSFYKWVRHRNFPDGYQVLCFNCNWGKYINGVYAHMLKILRSLLIHIFPRLKTKYGTLIEGSATVVKKTNCCF